MTNQDPIALPHRRIVLELKLEADSWTELEHGITSVQHRIFEQKGFDAPVDVVSGGCGNSHILTVRVNPQQDAAGYQRDLRAYLDRNEEVE